MTSRNTVRMLSDVETGLSREWLLTNGRGGFASGTAAGVPTRRYHGLLVASARPPLERWMLLSAVLERAGLGGQFYETAAFEFDGVFHPRGFEHLVDFAVHNAAPNPWVRFVYQAGELRLSKCVYLPRGHDEAVIAYRLEGPRGARLSLELCPFVAMRDFHGLMHAFSGGLPIDQGRGAVLVSAVGGSPKLWLTVESGEGQAGVSFDLQPDWWYGFHYREEAARGQDCREDLFIPGWFRAAGVGRIELTLRAKAEFPWRGEKEPPASGLFIVDVEPPAEPSVEDRLVEAADAFVVDRLRVDGTRATTILAGYHWFGDWGRDTFIALPGLLLETRRFAEAREVLATFASAQQDGLIPNRFSDYGDGCDYNSIDASLWYIHGADAYVRLSGDTAAWKELLGPVCERIVEAFLAGTQFNIHVAGDGLLACGDASTQLTWMDAKFGSIAFTPRHGKPVEINALWYHALHILARHAGGKGKTKSGRFIDLAERVRRAFVEQFWNPEGKYLYDVVRDEGRDDAIRPNQIFAVSLPDSPLSAEQQRAVVSCVERELLTPYGLRSLSPRHPAYRGHCAGGPFDRDSAYHQGTVWAWLIGPFVEAYLRVHGTSEATRQRMRACLRSLIEHLDSACIGSISEIFDGDPPYTPQGAIAQAWSVAEVLRAWRLSAATKRK